MRSLALFIVVIAAIPALAHGAKADRRVEEQQIRKRVQQWLEAVKKKDVKAIAGIYTEDGRIMVPNMPSAEGREAVAAVWEKLLATPGISLVFETKQIDVAEAGDMACEVGAYTIGFDNPEGGGKLRDKGKYVVVWQKVKGEWQVKTDIFNSDQTAPAAEAPQKK